MNLTKFSLNTNQAIRRSQSQNKLPIDFKEILTSILNAPGLINFVDCAGLITLAQKCPKLKKQEWSSRNPILVQPKPKELLYLPLITERVDSQLLKEVELLFPQLKTAIREYLKDPLINGFSDILFVGHGLGGAYASIAGYLWAKHITRVSGPHISRFIPEIHTFGAPRVGNKEFSESANMEIDHYRMTYGNDHVPHFPFATMGWKHFGYEIWIEPLDTCDCTEDQKKYWDCNGVELSRENKNTWIDDENEECNAGQPIDKIPDQFFHNGPYFGVEMSNCEQIEGFKKVFIY
ncbi:hypothetical protein G9A89_008531 [Geosiphon pyriformis]|nr:hypothetical protein G9A89_008531 [Geosiphon pyriformis]